MDKFRGWWSSWKLLFPWITSGWTKVMFLHLCKSSRLYSILQFRTRSSSFDINWCLCCHYYCRPILRVLNLCNSEITTTTLTTTRSIHLTTPTNLFGLWNIRSISRTPRKAQVKPGLNVRLILRQIRYVKLHVTLRVYCVGIAWHKHESLSERFEIYGWTDMKANIPKMEEQLQQKHLKRKETLREKMPLRMEIKKTKNSRKY